MGKSNIKDEEKNFIDLTKRIMTCSEEEYVFMARDVLSDIISDSFQITREDCERYLMAMITPDRYFDLLARINILDGWANHSSNNMDKCMTWYVKQIIAQKVAEKISPTYKNWITEGVEEFKIQSPKKLSLRVYRSIDKISAYLMRIQKYFYNDKVCSKENIQSTLEPIVDDLTFEQAHKFFHWGKYDDPLLSTTYSNFMDEVMDKVPSYCVAKYEKDIKYKVRELSPEELMKDISTTRYIMNKSGIKENSVAIDMNKINKKAIGQQSSNESVYEFTLMYLRKEFKNIFSNDKLTPEEQESGAKKLLMGLSNDLISDEEKIADMIEILGLFVLDKKVQLKLITYLMSRYNKLSKNNEVLKDSNIEMCM